MSNPEGQEVQARLDELIAATRKGSFQWRAVNPTTYLWERGDPLRGGPRLTLQRVEQNVVQRPPGGPPTPARQVFFILQVFDIKPNNPQMPLLTVSGSNDPQMNQKLEELFQLVTSGITQQSLEFLKNLISEV